MCDWRPSRWSFTCDYLQLLRVLFGRRSLIPSSHGTCTALYSLNYLTFYLIQQTHFSERIINEDLPSLFDGRIFAPYVLAGKKSEFCGQRVEEKVESTSFSSLFTTFLTFHFLLYLNYIQFFSKVNVYLCIFCNILVKSNRIENSQIYFLYHGRIKKVTSWNRMFTIFSKWQLIVKMYTYKSSAYIKIRARILLSMQLKLRW